MAKTKAPKKIDTSKYIFKIRSKSTGKFRGASVWAWTKAGKMWLFSHIKSIVAGHKKYGLSDFQADAIDYEVVCYKLTEIAAFDMENFYNNEDVAGTLAHLDVDTYYGD